MDYERAYDASDEEKLGHDALISVLSESFANTVFYNDTLFGALKTPVLRGISDGFDGIRFNTSEQNISNLRIGLYLALMAISRSEVLKLADQEITDSMLEGDIEQSNVWSSNLKEDDALIEASEGVIQGLFLDLQHDYVGYSQRLELALQNPLCRGVSNGFRQVTPIMASNGCPVDQITAIQIGLDMALIAASVPYSEMLASFEIPDTI